MISGVDYASIDGDKPPQIGSDYSFAIVRGSYTFHGLVQVDTNLKRDRDSWRAHGVTFGSYVILGYDPKGPTPEEQAHGFIAAYGDRRPGELPPFLDLETNSADSSHASGEERLKWAGLAYDVLVQRYGIVGIYTSCNQWTEHFAGEASRLGDGPLWIKVPYAWKEHNPPHPESCPSVVTEVPLPWRPASSAGAWIVQYQGDAKGAPGFSSTVDLNGWLPRRDTAPGLWVRQLLARKGLQDGKPYGDVRTFQREQGLSPDGVIGPKTFAALTHF